MTPIAVEACQVAHRVRHLVLVAPDVFVVRMKNSRRVRVCAASKLIAAPRGVGTSALKNGCV